MSFKLNLEHCDFFLQTQNIPHASIFFKVPLRRGFVIKPLPNDCKFRKNND